MTFRGLYLEVEHTFLVLVFHRQKCHSALPNCKGATKCGILQLPEERRSLSTTRTSFLSEAADEEERKKMDEAAVLEEDILL